MELKDKVAIITGAGQGGGEGIAHVLAREGARIAVVDLNLEAARRVASSLDPEGKRAIAIRADVSKKAEAQAMASQTLEAFGTIDILVNNAGVGGASALVCDVTEENWDHVMGVNAKGILFCCQAVIPAMKAQGKGVILNTASSSGVLYDREMIAYTTTKHAVIAMTRQMAGDYAGHGIRVNALCPGWVDTPFNAPFIAQMGGREAIESYIKDKVPMGRWADVEEIAEPILFLVSDRSSYMTGQILVVDGGETVT